MKRLMHNIRPIVTFGMFGVLLLGVLIQFIPYGRAQANPPVVAEPRWDSAQTREMFVNGCADCHSNQTAWPWYSNVAPVSWLITRDVQEGRTVFNVSEWGRPENEGDDSAETVQEGTMPPWFYTLLHPDASLSPGEKQAFINGLIATFGSETDEAGGEEAQGDDDDD